MSAPKRILYIDDSTHDRELVRDALNSGAGCFVLTEASTREMFEALLIKDAYDLVLSDFNILGFDGLQVIEAVHALDPKVPVVVVTGTGSEEIGVQAMKRGAADYVIKSPSHIQRLPQTIQAVLTAQNQRLERKRAEHRLRRSEERFRQLADSIQEVFWISEPLNQTMEYISPAYETIWGRSCESLYADPTSWLKAVHPEDRDGVRAALAQVPEGEGFEREYRIVRPDGGVRLIRARAFPTDPGKDGTYRLAGVAEDITERRQLEEQLRQSQKMDAIGQLAGGVAHDFNNILTAIMMQADYAATTQGTPATVLQLLDDIKAGTKRAASLTRQLLIFSRRQVLQTRRVDLNKIVTNLTEMLQRIVGEDVPLSLELHPGPLSTCADAGLLDQVLLNLVVNARDAMIKGGAITIGTELKTITELDLSAFPDLAPGPHVGIRVADTGSGIAPDILAKIFEPFFTTKEIGKGTGLGLATVFGIVKQHRGSVTVETEPGKGTTFLVLFPADATPDDITEMENEPVPASLQPPWGGTETVLLVEDEMIVRRITAMVLRQAGYTVWEAGNGPEALQVWDQATEGVQLLLTDIVMPAGMNGREVAAELQNRKQDLKVILMSGYSLDYSGKELMLQKKQFFIQKPCEPRRLLETVRQALDS